MKIRGSNALNYDLVIIKEMLLETIVWYYFILITLDKLFKRMPHLRIKNGSIMNSCLEGN